MLLAQLKPESLGGKKYEEGDVFRQSCVSVHAARVFIAATDDVGRSLTVRTMRLAVAVLLLGFGEPASAQVFFESTQSYRQAVELMGEVAVVLESSLPDSSVVVRRGDVEQVTLEITGTFSIVGYQGTLEAAGVRELTPPELAFRILRSPATITISSPERTWLHHALLIQQLTVTLPLDASLSFRRLRAPDDLEGRR